MLYGEFLRHFDRSDAQHREVEKSVKKLDFSTTAASQPPLEMTIPVPHIEPSWWAKAHPT
jgi:hypothetical protein